MFRLLVTYGQEEQVFAVPEKEALLGSATENNIVLRIPGVSRRHALVRPIPGGIEVLDLKSKNRLFVAGEQVTRAVLTPGLRVQVGTAWLEIEEISTSEEALALLSRRSSEPSLRPWCVTSPVRPQEDPESNSPGDAAFSLALHLAQVGVGVPGKRADLLARVKTILNAEAFASFDRRRHGKLRIWESVGSFVPDEVERLSSLVGSRQARVREDLILKRAGRLLLAGQDSWFLGARFTEDALAREGWRKEFLRALATQFFPPVRSLDQVDLAEARRVLGLARGNKSRTAALLGRARGTLDRLLAQLDLLL